MIQRECRQPGSTRVRVTAIISWAAGRQDLPVSISPTKLYALWRQFAGSTGERRTKTRHRRAA